MRGDWVCSCSEGASLGVLTFTIAKIYVACVFVAFAVPVCVCVYVCVCTGMYDAEDLRGLGVCGVCSTCMCVCMYVLAFVNAKIHTYIHIYIRGFYVCSVLQYLYVCVCVGMCVNMRMYVCTDGRPFGRRTTASSS
jgi:hypothetical protein